MASTISAGTSAGTAIAISGDTSGALVLQTNGTTTAVTLDTSQNATFAGKVTSAGALTLASNGTTTAVTIDTSQNVGIGTASPGSFGRFAVKQASDTSIPALGIVAQASTTDTFLSIGYSSISDTCRLYASYISTGAFKPISFWTSDAEQMRIDTAGLLKFNSGYGSVATAYGCRAWVNFNGTGTVAIRASGNVSSITDNGVGLYTVNFTTAMPDANYSAGGSVSKFNIYNDGNQVIQIGGVSGSLQTTSACKVATSHSSSTLVDCEVVTAIFFR